MRIRVCIAFYQEFETAKSGLRELLNCKEHEFVIEPRQGTGIGEVRNSLINDRKSKKKHQSPVEGFDAFLSVDSDVSFTLADVLKLIEHNKRIVGATYLSHISEPLYTAGTFGMVPGTIGVRYTMKKRGLHKVDWMGLGLMLIKREVFENMEYPWYRHKLIEQGEELTESGLGVGFCLHAKEQGEEIFCDFDLEIGHTLRTQKSFNWELGMTGETQPEGVYIENHLTKQKDTILKNAMHMAEQYDLAMAEISNCHAIIQNQANKIKSLEKNLIEQAKKLEKATSGIE